MVQMTIGRSQKTSTPMSKCAIIGIPQSYLKRAADAAFESDEMDSTKWFEVKRHTLRHDPNGVDK